MPEISCFFGILIKILYDDHNPQHFHAEYEDSTALIDMRNLSVFAGRLPPRIADNCDRGEIKMNPDL
jgi:hypothetical protein